MPQLIVFCCLFLAFLRVTLSQEVTPSLATFFQQRLNGAPTPTAEATMQVIDTIATADPRSITAAIPLMKTALSGDKELTSEALLAIYAINRRQDGAALLRAYSGEGDQDSELMPITIPG
jgi:hypothetical protein